MRRLAPALLWLGLGVSAFAQENPMQGDRFERGAFEIQMGLSYHASFNTGKNERPHVRDMDAHVRFGWMISSPGGKGTSRGNTEFLAELLAAGVLEGPGHSIVGGTLFVRHNFLGQGGTTVPYVQLGAGGVDNDIHRDRRQSLIGQAFEFNLQLGAGLRLLQSPRTGWFFEVTWRHISNANMSDRNFGLNSLGFQIGSTWRG